MSPASFEPPAERQIWVVRHGETAWAAAGRHTGRTDIPLTDVGRDQARAVAARLAYRRFALILTSPLSRAAETAEIAGFGDVAQADVDLQEWDYGEFEGLTRPEIRARVADWSIWTGPWPAGETPELVGERADRVIARCLAPDVDGDALLVAHGHLLRVLAARWLRMEPQAGRFFALSTATVGVLGWDRENPVIESWNEACRLG